MRVLKIILGALAITAVSAVLLTILSGRPNMERLPRNLLYMFVPAVLVLAITIKK